ncbi:MAG: PIN domain-containing protein [Bacteroidota bacterium]
MIGVIRQELLSGIRHEHQFHLLKEKLSSFPDQPLLTHHFELAAQCYNTCRAQGIQASHIDFLITAFCLHENVSLLTNDKDFDNIANVTGLRLLAQP